MDHHWQVLKQCHGHSASHRQGIHPYLIYCNNSQQEEWDGDPYLRVQCSLQNFREEHWKRSVWTTVHWNLGLDVIPQLWPMWFPDVVGWFGYPGVVRWVDMLSLVWATMPGQQQRLSTTWLSWGGSFEDGPIRYWICFAWVSWRRHPEGFVIDHLNPTHEETKETQKLSNFLFLSFFFGVVYTAYSAKNIEAYIS